MTSIHRRCGLEKGIVHFPSKQINRVRAEDGPGGSRGLQFSLFQMCSV